MDLSHALTETMRDYGSYAGRILHFSNETENPGGISWYEFAKEILRISKIETPVHAITTAEYPTKAKRPAHSRLLNDSDIRLPNWRESLEKHLLNPLRSHG